MQQSALAAILKACGPLDTGSPDDRLLADFFAHRDERAFAALVRRHERTVWGVCRRVLSNPADAEDAFQATFLVLVCRGRTLADRGSIGGWLYRVAHRMSLKTRAISMKRKRREERSAKAEGISPEADEHSDLMAVIGEELEGLSEVHRMAVIVCDLDGLSRAEAAVRLGCSEGTLSARLHRGRKQLAERLRSRGISTPLAGLIGLAGFAASAPPSLGQATADLATTVAVVGISNRAVPASVAVLVSGTVREMTMRFTTKVLAVLLLSTGLVGGGWLGLTSAPVGTAQAAPVPAAKDETQVNIPGSAYELIRHRKVLKELKCTAEQRVQIEDAFDDLAEKQPRGGGFALTINPGNANNPQAIQQQIEEMMKKQREDAQAESKGIAEKHLKREQLVRLGQIELQTKGPNAFTDEKVAAALKLTDKQKTAVKEAIDEMVPTARAGNVANIAGPGGVVVFNTTSGSNDSKAKKEAVEKIEKDLSKDQLATWKTMIGEKIAFELPPHGVSTGFARAGFNMAMPAMPAMPLLPAAPPMVAPPLPKKD